MNSSDSLNEMENLQETNQPLETTEQEQNIVEETIQTSPVEPEEKNPADNVDLPTDLDNAPVSEVQNVEKQESAQENSEKFNELSKKELVDRLKELIKENVDQIKEEVENIKQAFYKKNKVELDEQRTAFLESGGDELNFIPSPLELEEEFKTLLNEYKAKKAKATAELEQEKENNLLKKNHILEQMKQLLENKDDVSSSINTFRQLQQEWKNTGQVPASANTELWKQYNQYQEAFWDLIKINNELREYDFKKNLEGKTKLIEAAEALDKEEDVVSAFRQLQNLHEEWHELGPVAREIRDEIWNRFKEASTVINKKHQAHFDEIRKLEDQNLNAKIALCEKIEAIDTSNFKTYKDWDDATKQVLELQEEWRTIGFAPRKSNQKVFDRYRKACDTFFSAKAEFYKEIKSNLNENLEKKIALCERAEALKDSTDWKTTTDEFIKLQKEWKTIGPVQKRHSDEIWKRFITACDYFFEQRNKNVNGQKGEEQQNLEKKLGLIEKIKNFKKTDNASESLAALRELAAEWNSIGHVPFKEKDKIYKSYREALDAQFDSLNIDATQRRLESFRNNLKDIESQGDNKLYREREKLVRAYEHMKSEIATYENNIGFLSVSSKKGGGMLQEMERKIDSLKEECRLLEQKINLIDEQIQ